MSFCVKVWHQSTYVKVCGLRHADLRSHKRIKATAQVKLSWCIEKIFKELKSLYRKILGYILELIFEGRDHSTNCGISPVPIHFCLPSITQSHLAGQAHATQTSKTAGYSTLRKSKIEVMMVGSHPALAVLLTSWISWNIGSRWVECPKKIRTPIAIHCLTTQRS